MKVILAVDPGEKNIGLAKSDPLGIGATALCVISHVQMEKDARTIAEKARECGASSILVGQPLNADGSEGPKAPTSVLRGCARRARDPRDDQDRAVRPRRKVQPQTQEPRQKDRRQRQHRRRRRHRLRQRGVCGRRSQAGHSRHHRDR